MIDFNSIFTFYNDHDSNNSRYKNTIKFNMNEYGFQNFYKGSFKKNRSRDDWDDWALSLMIDSPNHTNDNFTTTDDILRVMLLKKLVKIYLLD